MKQYPNELIRGVANASELISGGNASVSLFIFRNNELREDNKQELSINWCDDKTQALSVTMNQTKQDGSYQFKAGAAILSREMLDTMKRTPICKGKLDYERAPIENNEFHGNITCVAGLDNQTMALIRSALVHCVTDIHRRE